MANPQSSPTFDWKMYRYTPSLPLAMIFLILFSILTLMHTYSYIRHRRSSTIYIILGSVCEVGGFGARIGSHYDNTSWAPFTTQGTLLLVGPLFFAATIYTMLGRTIRVAEASSIARISPRWYTRIFVAADISTLIIQGLGAGIMGTMQLSLALAGEKIVIAGLALQVATFIVFLFAAVDFHIRMARRSNAEDSNTGPKSAIKLYRNSSWKKMIHILYTLSVLILFRCVFRLVEYAMGNAAYLIANEWTLYAFDGIPMFSVSVLLFVFQPSKLSTSRGSKMDNSSDRELGVMVD